MNMSIFYKNKFPFFEIREVNRCTCKKDFHINFSLNILIIETGVIEIISNNKKKTLKKGDIFIINILENHKCNNILDSNVKYYIISIDIKKLYLLHNSLYNNLILPKYHNFIYDKELFNELLYFCKTITKDRLLNLKQNYMLHLFIITIIEKYSQKIQISIKDYSKINAVLKYIYIHYKENITVKDIAKSLNTSSYDINRIFTKYFNITVYKLIISYRVYKSKKYIYKGYNFNYIAHKVGFFEQSHFHKNFKKHFELTPKEYYNSYFNL